MIIPLKRYLASMVLALAMVACSDKASAPPEPAIMEDGPTVARHLKERYDETNDDCGTPARPAFLCSGILLRATGYSVAYRSWLPNPATAPWGVSFSWLRQDSNFPDSFPSGNGFIVYPWFHADDVPGQYEQLHVRCIYPQDAWTGSPDRCLSGPADERLEVCQKEGVYTAAQWLDRFTDDKDQCAFDVAYGTEQTAHAWTQVKLVREQRRIFRRNEVVVAAWPQEVGDRMPLEAFFYRDNCFDHDDCMEYPLMQRIVHAKRDQNDFFQHTNRWVPVIRWTPAVSATEPATFTYNPDDQGTPPPTPKP
jgi:hypothetical protein